MRDLSRAREDAQQDLLRKRHQLSKFLLRLDLRPPDGVKAWTTAHRRWLEGLKFAETMHQIVFSEYLHAIDETADRVERLEKALLEHARTSAQLPLIEALQCLRGVAALTATTVVAEIGDLTRFTSAKQAMDYLGLVSSEDSSGPRQRRGSITKSGNAHARWVLVESAWNYRHPPRVGYALRKRQQDQPETVKRIAWKAQQRLHLKYRRLLGRGKAKQVVVVAVARELVGFMWAIAQELAQRQGVKSVA